MSKEWEIIPSRDSFGKVFYIFKEKPDSGGACLGYAIGILIIIVAVLGTFALPYNFVCSEISSYKINWLHNENVWIFSFTFWLSLLSLYVFIRSIILNLGDKFVFDDIFEIPFLTIPMLLCSIAILSAYILKSWNENLFQLYYTINSILLLSFLHILVRYSKNKFKIALYFVVGLTLLISYKIVNSKNNLHDVQEKIVTQKVS
jgi:hypothetical protein